MRILLDAHTLIWWVDQDQRLGRNAHAAIADSANEILVGAGPLWEIGIKVSLGKLSLAMSYLDWIRQAFVDTGASLLAISPDHVEEQRLLPWHHRDPFDRLMIAQARVEQLHLASNESMFDQYNVQRLW